MKRMELGVSWEEYWYKNFPEISSLTKKKKKRQQGSIETQRFIPAYERKGQLSTKVRNRELYTLAVLSEQKPELSKMFQASSGRCEEASNIPRSCHLQIKKSIRNIIPENKYKLISELVQQKKKKKKEKYICQSR